MKSDMIDAVCKEIETRSTYLTDNQLESIYFGGGTPSLLSQTDLSKIFESIGRFFTISNDCEITLEANPDDLTNTNLAMFRNTGVNRLSIGIQSFNENQLKFMNRAHNAFEAENCVQLAQNQGFKNITIDLIYGIPHQNHDIWIENLGKAINLKVNHISAYCLTIEPKTVFGNLVKNRKMELINDHFSSEQFEILMNTLQENNFEQYEISNFARNKQYSLHNSRYWLGKQYLGVGPSAHSFNGISRQYNVSNNNRYIKSIMNNSTNFEIEYLTEKNRCNEHVLTKLRTIWGLEIDQLQDLSKGEFLKENQEIINQYIKSNQISIINNTLKLTKKGKFFVDKIASDLFLV